MNWTVVQRILGLLLMMFSLTMLPPVLFSAAVRRWRLVVHLSKVSALRSPAGFLCWFPGPPFAQGPEAAATASSIVAAFWTVLGIVRCGAACTLRTAIDADAGPTPSSSQCRD